MRGRVQASHERASLRQVPDASSPFRKKAGPTQVALATRVSCRANTIRELEHDQYQPALALAEAMSRELGVDLLTLFPSLKVTKEEAEKVLRIGSRTLKRLCANGQLPCDDDAYWHRIDYAAVLRLETDRERLAQEWISLHAATRETGLPWWVLRQLERAGAFGDDVMIVRAEGGRPVHYVKRLTPEAVHRELIANYRRVRCPRCKLPVKLGRTAHARCPGPLGSRAYWKIGADAATRAERSSEHSRRVRSGLRRTERTVANVARWYVKSLRTPADASVVRTLVALEGWRAGPGRRFDRPVRREDREGARTSPGSIRPGASGRLPSRLDSLAARCEQHSVARSTDGPTKRTTSLGRFCT